MIAIIFEVIPAVGRKQDYLDIAVAMRPMVEEIEGFISVERFQSMSNPDKLLSISFFEDQAAVDRWRALAEHRAAQRLGREGIFSDYRLKVTQVLRDYGMHKRAEAPADSRAHHDT